MKKIAFLVGIVAGVAGMAATAEAGNSRYITPPPVVLSPNLTDAWVMQLQPGYRMRVKPQPVALHVAIPAEPAVVVPKVEAIDRTKGTDPEFLPQEVDYSTDERPGTIIIDTNSKHLYLVEEGGRAMRYGVGVGKPGFEWSGVHEISRKAEWPDWHPPVEMRQRRPELPLMMAGGPRNPLGARAMYLGSTLYRIHGTSEPWSIGHAVSSGCIRMRNEDVIDLYDRVPVGTKVIVM